MSASLSLGIDFGTSGARACVIAPGEEIEALERVEFGVVDEEQRAAAWLDVLEQLVAQIPEGVRRRLSTLAIDGTSGTVLAHDRDLKPLGPALLYNDTRAMLEAEKIARQAGADHTAASATSGLAKILWLQAWKANPRVSGYLNQADWLAARLTGKAGISDFHNTLKMGFDVERQRWPDWLARLLSPSFLPDAMQPGAPIGLIEGSMANRLGVHRDCLIRAGTTDSIAAFLAAKVHQPGEAVTSLGTTLVLKLVSEARVESAQYGVYSHWFGRHWLAGGASNCGGGALLKHFSLAELAYLSRDIDPQQPSGLDYYPLPGVGERFPINDPEMQARIDPIPENRMHFLHGLLEGEARVEALGYRRLLELGATPLSRVLSAGGGANNPVLTDIRRHLLQVPVATAANQEAAFGTARLALHGTQIFPGIRA